MFLLIGFDWWLDRFDLLFERTGAVWGVGYTDEHARIPAFSVMAGASVLAAIAMFVSARDGMLRRPVTVIGAYFIARMLIANAWPGVVQEYSVKPNELGMETEYLERNIEATRSAFALDRRLRRFGILSPQERLPSKSENSSPIRTTCEFFQISILLFSSRPTRDQRDQRPETRDQRMC